ncbi:hypothetical protein BHYA_0428g00030 [Botrytis hyacinthi]|uniref:Uncharacterized protein n=1 Tax=Botrytis hyacinthi TaxID=278943 RepID=A0A4Z1G412_9HELO|nr:hypothetical protein BHYA_0428g00030 [Botrytis hyacinthi]
MAPSSLELEYPRWNNPVLDQRYFRWNKLFDTMDFDDDESLGKILQAAGAAERFHPFNLKLIEGTDLNEFEMVAVRDLSYAFNRNFLCRDIVRHLILFSRYEDKVFTLGKATKLCTDILKITKLSPVRQPDMYLQVRREFCRLAPDVENLDEDEAEAELDRWARWGHHETRVITGPRIRQAAQGGDDDSVSSESMNANVENSQEVSSVKNAAEAEIFEAAKALISMSTQESADGLIVTPVPTTQKQISNKRKLEEPCSGQENE